MHSRDEKQRQRSRASMDARSDEAELMGLPAVYGRDGDSLGRSQESVPV